MLQHSNRTCIWSIYLSVGRIFMNSLIEGCCLLGCYWTVTEYLSHRWPRLCTQMTTVMLTDGHGYAHRWLRLCSHITTVMLTDDHGYTHRWLRLCSHMTTVMLTYHHGYAHRWPLLCSQMTTVMLTDDHCCAPFPVITIVSSPYSRLITEFVARLTGRVPLEEQEFIPTFVM
jgi:hypothetical protein